MRDKKRIPDILARLGNVWEKYPDLRLGQLIVNVVDDASLLYMLEDNELIEGIEKVYEHE